VIYLVRHAKAGSRQDFTGDDVLRPLSKRGRQQADAIAERLRSADVTELLSSPYVRCMQTLQPLGNLTGLPVKDDDRLAEGDDFAGALELLARVPDRAVVCSHGDVIPAVIAALQRRGCDIRSAPEWRKGSVWVLERHEHGQFVTAEAWPPPSTA
jgi:8-oxo-dGTP diphosphatase